VVEFEVVLRGFDRFTVDALVQAVEAAAGDQRQIAAAIKEVTPLPVVMRGYDRAQVDAWLTRCQTGNRGAGPDQEPNAEPVEFSIVLRGYRVAETDALHATVQAALVSGDAARRNEAVHMITEARLPIGFRGYDRGQVDRCLERVADQLRAL
jgi:DivIVA domain-containing protein